MNGEPFDEFWTAEKQTVEMFIYPEDMRHVWGGDGGAEGRENLLFGKKDCG